MAEISDSGGTLHVICRSCGKPWPSGYGACPEDGTLLATPATRPSSVHAAETMPLPGRHPTAPVAVPRVETADLATIRRAPWSEPPTPPVSDHTSVDISPAHTIRGTIDGREASLVPFDTPFDGATDPDHKVGPNFLVAKATKARDAPPPPRQPVEPAERFDEPDADTAIHDRARHVLPPRTGPKPSSSDPPTSVGHRNDHIDLPSGSVVNNEYEIEQRIGAGAMGEVYAAKHQRLGKRVAIKVMSPRISSDIDAVERFEQEARTLAMIHHPGIVDVIGFGQLADTRSYFVMEYLRGESLEERIDRGRVPLGEALDILDQMARALEAAHAQQVVHRDLKPANTFLVRLAGEARPIVKLLDFGLAKLAAAADQRAERTQSGVVIGTALYLSPEQCRGPNVDGRSDIYSLGCIAYELLLGTVPFPAATTMATLIAAHMHQAPPLPRTIWPDIPPTLDLLLFGMLAKDPAHRPTLAQIRQVLASVRSPAPAPARAPGARATAPQRAPTFVEPMQPAVPAAPRRGAPVLTMTLVAAALIGGILIGAAVRGSHSAGTPQPAPVPAVAPPADAAVTAVPIAPPVLAVDAALAVTPPIAADAAVVPIAAPAQDAGRDAPAAALTGSSSGSAVAPAGSAAPSPATPSVPPPTIGYLLVTSKPPSKVLVDDVATGLSTPITGKQLPLAPGKHRITFVLAGDKYTYRVSITAGETQALDKDLQDTNLIIDPFPAKQPGSPDVTHAPR